MDKVKTLGNYSPSEHNASKIVDVDYAAPTVRENHGTVTAIAMPKVVGGIGNKCNNDTQYHQRKRIYEGDYSVCIGTTDNPYYTTEAKVLGNLSGGKWDKTYESARSVYDPERVSPSICTHGGGNQEEKFLMNDLRIRKLTPTECFRLMGVKDEDSEKLANMSNSTKYHLAGDSIVTTVLMAIFGELLEVEWKGKVNNLHG